MKMKKLILLILAFLLIVSQTACSPNNQTKESGAKDSETAKLSGTIKLGMGFALSGPYETPTKGHRSAMEMAVEDVNNSGILGAAKFEIAREDSMHTVEGAINAFQKLVVTDKVLATFGPPTGPQSMSALPVAQKTGVLAFASSTLASVPKIGDYVFVTSPIIIDMIPSALDKIVAARNIKTVAMLTQKDYPAGVQSSVVRRQEFKKLGVEIILDEEGLKTDTNFSTTITKIMNKKPDMVIVDGDDPHDPLFLRQLKNAGYKGTIMAGTATVPPKVTSSNPVAFEGVINLVGWMPDMPNASDKAKDFTKRFKEKYGFLPDQFAVGVYDNVWLLANAIKQVGSVSDSKALRDAVANIEYEGVQGKLKFNANRTQEHSPVLFETKNGVQVPMNI